MTKIKMGSDWGMIDVREGRHELADHFKNNAPRLGPCPPEVRVPVFIRGYITGDIGDDDGISIEFGMDIERIHVGEIGADLDD